MNSSFEAVEEKMKEAASLAERLGSILRGVFSAAEEKAPVAEKAAKPAAVEANGQAEKKEEKLSQSEMVRQCIKSNPEARNKDVIDIIKRDHGVEVAASLVSYIRSKEANKKPRADAKKAGGVKKATTRTARIVSNSSLIRQYLEKNPKAENDEVLKEIKKSHKVEVKPTLVSSVRAILKRKGFKTARISLKVATKEKKDRKGLPMPALIVRVLEKAPREGMKLREMTDKVIAAGYEYQGNKGWEGIAQNVYQAVHTLSKSIPHAGYEGKTPVVLHDMASKRWKLNRKATKKKVA
jgi:hypothetical protein